MTIEKAKLTAAQSARKAELETVIKGGIESFRVVGEALAEIRDNKLYLDECDTFEDYLDEKWGLSRRRGYQLIDGAKVAKSCEQIVHIGSEGAARPLTKLEPKDQVKAAKILAKTTGPVTAKNVQAVVQKLAPRGGLASTIHPPTLPDSAVEDHSQAARKIEGWWQTERATLLTYPAVTPERLVELILRLLRQ